MKEGDYHYMRDIDGETYRVIVLNWLPWDRLCSAITFLKKHRPEQFDLLHDKNVQTLMREFNGGFEILFKDKP